MSPSEERRNCLSAIANGGMPPRPSPGKRGGATPMEYVCSICGTQGFSVINGAGEVHQIPLQCNRCKAVVCFKCAGRFYDHSGVRMLSCPQCLARQSLVDPTQR
jgi:hypothetical protein